MMSYREFSETITSPTLNIDLGKLRKEVRNALRWYLDEHGQKRDGEAYKDLFDRSIIPLTKELKKGGNTASSYSSMIDDSWARGDRGDADLAIAAYYWLHRAVENKQYARRIDAELKKRDFSADFPTLGKPRGSDEEMPPFPSASELLRGDEAIVATQVAAYLRRNPTPFFLNMPGTGYEFKDLLEVAQEELFVCGQNLFGLTKETRGETYVTLERIQRAVDRGVTVRLMICNPDETDHFRPWSFAVGADDYKDHLLKAAKIFHDWGAKFSNGEFSVRFARFVPTSINFVDPRRPGKRLATITAHHFVPVRTARPFILLPPQADPRIFDLYFDNYEYVWDHANKPFEVAALR
jgi:hypothetical protein